MSKTTDYSDIYHTFLGLLSSLQMPVKALMSLSCLGGNLSNPALYKGLQLITNTLSL